MYEEFFTEIGPLTRLNNSFGNAVKGFIDVEVCPKLDAFLLSAIENQRPAIIFKSISLIIIICGSFEIIPNSLQITLEERFPSLLNRVSFEDCHRLNGFHSLKESLSRAIVNKHQSSTLWKGINQLKTVLLVK